MSESSAWLWIPRWRDSEDWAVPLTKARQTRTPTREPRTPAQSFGEDRSARLDAQLEQVQPLRILAFDGVVGAVRPRDEVVTVLNHRLWITHRSTSIVRKRRHRRLVLRAHRDRRLRRCVAPPIRRREGPDPRGNWSPRCRGRAHRQHGCPRPRRETDHRHPGRSSFISRRTELHRSAERAWLRVRASVGGRTARAAVLPEGRAATPHSPHPHGRNHKRILAKTTAVS